MKKIIAVIFVAISLFVVAFAFDKNKNQENNNSFLRIHIRANSNCQIDQDVKYLVRDAVVDGLTPLFANINTKGEAVGALENSLPYITGIANEVLAQNGFGYTAKARVCNEFFPTRVYSDVCLDEGFYDALILELGDGVGDNWWCVVYPPLCFLENNIGGSAGTIYKSKLLEIIRRALK